MMSETIQFHRGDCLLNRHLSDVDYTDQKADYTDYKDNEDHKGKLGVFGIRYKISLK